MWPEVRIFVHGTKKQQSLCDRAHQFGIKEHFDFVLLRIAYTSGGGPSIYGPSYHRLGISLNLLYKP